ncbi:MAG: hypothetical protein EOO54_11760 [Haliea sp.]|nr:MAG: hypothetical protein EOO54_11760 [Haliea sp.]
MLTMAGMLHACGAIKLAYNQAPQLTYLYLDGYVDFNSAQSVKVKEDLHRLHDWHRQTQLPGYVESLQSLRQQLAGDLQPQAACRVVEDARSKMLAVSAQAEPALAAIIPTLEAYQLKQLEKKFAKRNADYRDDYIDGTPQKLRAKRIKEAVKRAEMLYGNLDDRQLALVASRIDASAFDAERGYTEQLRRQRDTLQTLAPLISGGATPEQSRLALRRLMDRTLTSPDKDYRSYAEAFTRENCATFAELHNSTSAKQRAKAAEVLRGYEDHFRGLATSPA